MALPDVASGGPHVASHNEERHMINALQDITDPVFLAALEAAISLVTDGLDTRLTAAEDMLADHEAILNPVLPIFISASGALVGNSPTWTGDLPDGYAINDSIIGAVARSQGTPTLTAGFSQIAAPSGVLLVQGQKMSATPANVPMAGDGFTDATYAFVAYHGVTTTTQVTAVGTTTAPLVLAAPARVLHVALNTGLATAPVAPSGTTSRQSIADPNTANGNGGITFAEDQVYSGTVPARTFTGATHVVTLTLKS